MRRIHDNRCLDRPSLRPGRRIPGGLTWGYHHSREAERHWGVGLERGFRWRAYLLAGRLTVWIGAW